MRRTGKLRVNPERLFLGSLAMDLCGILVGVCSMDQDSVYGIVNMGIQGFQVRDPYQIRGPYPGPRYEL